MIMVTSANWQKWCRLCGKSELGDSSIKYESFGNLTFIIQKHFSISVSEGYKKINRDSENIEINAMPTFFHMFNRYRKQIVQQSILFVLNATNSSLNQSDSPKNALKLIYYSIKYYRQMKIYRLISIICRLYDMKLDQIKTKYVYI